MPLRVIRILPLVLAVAACASPRGAERAPAPASAPDAWAAAASTRDPRPAAVSPPHTALTVRTEERFYDVHGTSASRINLELASRGPRHGGVHWHALTDFALRWSYVPRRVGGRCAPGRVSLEVDVVTTLPRWDDRPRAEAALVSDWQLYMHRLRAHEDVHRAIAVWGGRELLHSVALLSAPDCRSLGEEAQRLARRVQAEVDGAQSAWDRLTDYGMGAGR